VVPRHKVVTWEERGSVQPLPKLRHQQPCSRLHEREEILADAIGYENKSLSILNPE
jgi:hypothetical protein